MSDDEEAMGDEWAEAMGEQADSEADAVEKAALDQLEDSAAMVADNGDGPDLDVIMDLPVTISMEVGNSEISIRNLLQLNQGSVVELDRVAGEPLDVLVNGTLVAHGEVVVVNDKFGIRLTDIISPRERVNKLK